MKLHHTILTLALALLFSALPIYAQPEGWELDEDNYTEGWIFAGAEEVTRFQLPNDENTTLDYSVGCIPYYDPTCCAAWTDSNWVEFASLKPTEEIDDNFLMFGGVTVYMENNLGEDLMIGGTLEDFIAPVIVTASYDPDFIETMKMVPEGFHVMYYDEWDESWQETNSDFEFNYEDNIVTIEGYEVHQFYGFFAREFYNRAPKFLEVADEIAAMEGDVGWIEVSYTDPDDIYEAYLEIDHGDFPGTLDFYETDIGEGEIIMRSRDGDVGEYTAILILTDDAGETTEHEIDLIISENLSANTQSPEFLPAQTQLQAGYPNPFNPSTTLHFSLHKSSNVSLEIFNINGVRVATLMKDNLPAGNHSAVWDVRSQGSVSAGSYIAMLHAGNERHQRLLQYIR